MMNEAARISVVIPTFNRIEQLRMVLPSYLASDLVCEVLVVDDHSSEQVSLSLDDLLSTDPRLKCLRNERNLGLPASRNRGVDQAAGDWILQSEDDLALGANFLETLCAHAQTSGADVIAGRRIWMRLGETEEDALARADQNGGDLFNEWLLEHNSHAITPNDVETPLLNATMLIRREVLEEVQFHGPYGVQSSWREDSDFQLGALEHGYKLVFCPHAVCFHYSRASQSFGGSRIRGTAEYAYRVYRNNLIFLERHRDYLRMRYPKSILLGSPKFSALLYGAYRAGWLLAAEAVRAFRARRHGGFTWK